MVCLQTKLDKNELSYDFFSETPHLAAVVESFATIKHFPRRNNLIENVPFISA